MVRSYIIIVYAHKKEIYIYTFGYIQIMSYMKVDPQLHMQLFVFNMTYFQSSLIAKLQNRIKSIFDLMIQGVHLQNHKDYGYA